MDYKQAELENLLENTADFSLKRKARRIIEEINPQNKDKILEVGSGDAYYPSILARLGRFFIVGLEIDKRVIDTAERNFKNLNIQYMRLKRWTNPKKRRTYFIEGNVLSMTFSNSYFDKVIMSEVAEHLTNDLKGLQEVYRVLKSRGILVLTVPNWNYPFLWDPVNWILQRIPNDHHIKSGFWAGIWNQHKRLYREDEIVDVVKKAGFKIEKTEIQTRWCLPFNHFIINIGARLLTGGVLPKSLHSQMNKFEETNTNKRSFLIKIYYSFAKFADSFNKSHFSKVGTTIFIKALKI